MLHKGSTGGALGSNTLVLQEKNERFAYDKRTCLQMRAEKAWLVLAKACMRVYGVGWGLGRMNGQ